MPDDADFKRNTGRDGGDVVTNIEAASRRIMMGGALAGIKQLCGTARFPDESDDAVSATALQARAGQRGAIEISPRAHRHAGIAHELCRHQARGRSELRWRRLIRQRSQHFALMPSASADIGIVDDIMARSLTPAQRLASMPQQRAIIYAWAA